MKVKLLICMCCSIPVLGLAQKQKKGKGSGAIIIAGKPLTSTDSAIVKQLFFSGMREKTIENYPLATELFTQVLQTDPANDASLYELANLKKAQNDNAGAQELLERAVTVNPDNEWYWVNLADCYEKSNNLGKLDNVFNELIRINPDKPEYYYDRANAYFLEKKYDEALDVYKKLEELIGPGDELIAKRQQVYLKQGKVDLAAADLENAIAANPNEIRYYLLLAELYNANGFADKALKVLLGAEKMNAGNGQVHLALADIYRDKKDNEASFKELTIAFAIPDLDIDLKIRIVLGYLPKFPDPNAKASALELSRVLTVTHPSNSKAFALYGDMLIQNSNYKEAKLNYKKSIALNDKVYEVQEQLVRIELGDNDIDSAIKDGENTLSLFPNQAWINYLVGIVLVQKKDYNKALGYIKNATSLESQDKDLLSLSYSSLGDCYHSLNELQKSDEAYEKALTYNPDNAFTLNNYAYYLSLRNMAFDKAAEMSKHSNDLQPNTSSFEDTYAWILFKQKKYNEAKVWMEKALADDKNHSAVQFEHYGDIMFYLGNADAAMQNWKKAKDNGGGSPILDRKINEKKYIE